MGSFILDSLPTLTEVDIMYGSFTSAKWLIPLIADASLSCGLKEDDCRCQSELRIERRRDKGSTSVHSYGNLQQIPLAKGSELMLFFFNFKAGFYERFYSYFDTQTIIRSFKAFLEERALAIAAREREVR